jgi:hypothetical protein
LPVLGLLGGPAYGGLALRGGRARARERGGAQRTKARLQPCLKKWTVVHLCTESAASSREPQRNRLGAESALADALGRGTKGSWAVTE